MHHIFYIVLMGMILMATDFENVTHLQYNVSIKLYAPKMFLYIIKYVAPTLK